MPSEIKLKIANVIAMRWSLCESIVAPQSLLPPSIIMPSSVSLTTAPIFVNSSVITRIRLDSLTLSSAASFIIVVPSAVVAMAAMTGSSSIRVGMIAPSIVIPCSLEKDTCISAELSEEALYSFKYSIFAPISLETLIMPSLVGLIPTFLITISEPGSIRAAAIKYAADDISPGTAMSQP